MATIGFIGLGRMGRPMAANLRRKGFDLVVHDVNPEPVRVLEAAGARAANGAGGVAQASEVVITMLPSSVEVEATVLGADGVLANGRAGQIVMDMSTVEPRTTDLLAASAAARGLSVVDAPVGRLAAHLTTLRQMSLSVAAMLQAGENPNLEAAVVKDVGTVFEQSVPEIAHALLGLEPSLTAESQLQRVLAYLTQQAPSFSLRGGTREVLRGIIARGLGLR